MEIMNKLRETVREWFFPVCMVMMTAGIVIHIFEQMLGN